MITDTLTAGALIRREVRAMLDVEGISWREHRGWIESTFVVTGTPRQMRNLNRRLSGVS